MLYEFDPVSSKMDSYIEQVLIVLSDNHWSITVEDSDTFFVYCMLYILPFVPLYNKYMEINFNI